MVRPECETLVVGAGPAGCRVARRLAEAGHSVVLADENPAARERVVCTGIVGREAFERLDVPRGPVVETVERAVFRSPSGREIVHDPPGALAHVVDRTRFDAALAREAEDAGARVLRGWAARGVEKDPGGVEVAFETEEGPRRVRTRALVVATGHQRWLHEAAGLGTPAGYVHGVHADLPFGGARGAEIYFGTGLAPGFFAWAVPFGEGRARLGVLAPQGARRHFRRFLRHPSVRERVTLPPARDGADPVAARVRSRGIVQGAVSPSFARRVVAVGEAAGQVKTTTAGGIYYGLQGAELAAEVLDDALLSGRLGEAGLSRYGEAWRARLEGEIEAGLQLQAVAGEMEDEEIDGLFRRLEGVLGTVIERFIRFDWHRPALAVLFTQRAFRDPPEVPSGAMRSAG